MRRSVRLLAGLVLISLVAAAAGASTAKHCITVLYPNSPGVHFDFEYYKSHHIPLIKRLYGRGVAKIELRRGVSTQDGSPVPYVAVINIWIGSQKVFDEATLQHAKDLIADVPNFTNGHPVIQTDEIVY